MLRTDRLEAVAAQVAELVERTPLPLDGLPPPLPMLLTIGRSLGINPESTLRLTAGQWLRSSVAAASADPARADRIAAWLADLIAWLRDERTDPPAELDLTPGPSSASGEANAS